MAVITVSLRMGEESIVSALQKATESLTDAEDELVLDFVSMNRVDPAALREIERLASKAAERAINVALRGVNTDVYKVLKLAKLAPRFSFLSCDQTGVAMEVERHAKRSTK